MTLRLSVKDLGVAYCGRPILKHVTFDIEGGTLVCVAGRNAAGKTTLKGRRGHDAAYRGRYAYRRQ